MPLSAPPLTCAGNELKLVAIQFGNFSIRRSLCFNWAIAGMARRMAVCNQGSDRSSSAGRTDANSDGCQALPRDSIQPLTRTGLSLPHRLIVRASGSRVRRRC